MKTMTKAGTFVTLFAVLSLVAVPPAWGATGQYRLLVDTGGGFIDPGPTMTIAPGTYSLAVQFRTTDNKWVSGANDVYGGAIGFNINILDSSGIGAASLIGLADDGGGNWAGAIAPTMAPVLPYTAATNTGLLNTTKTVAPAGDYDDLGLSASMQVNSTHYNRARGAMGGGTLPTGTAPGPNDFWFTVASGHFTFSALSGQSATLGVVSNSSINQATKIVTAATGTTSAYITNANTTWDSLVLTAPSSGGGTVDPALVAVANNTMSAMDNSGAYTGRDTTWTQPAGPGMWWNPGATIPLNAPTGLPLSPFTFTWTITDGTHSYTTPPVSGNTTVSVAQLMSSPGGWPAPPAPAGEFANIYLTITDAATGNFGIGVDQLNGNAGVPLFLPEPASLVVLGLGAVVGLLRRRRK